MRSLGIQKSVTKSSDDSSFLSQNRKPLDEQESSSSERADQDTIFGPGIRNFSRISILLSSNYTVQPKLKINSPDDKYEQEADRVAEQVMRMPEATVQRKCTSNREAEIQRTPDITLQRKCTSCEEEEVIQTKSNGNSDNLASPGLMNQIQSTRGGGQAMDTNTRSFMESRFGADFSLVRIHDNHQAARMNQEINAKAFTVGRDVYFNRGAYQPRAVEGKRLLAHELTHVVQQGGGINANAPFRKNLVASERNSPPQLGIVNSPVQVYRAGIGEMWDALWGVGPLDAIKAKGIADRALTAAQVTGLPGIEDGPADAWRHCYWNCLMTGGIGESQAKTIADNHEKHGSGTANANAMDLHNNAAGRECGGTSCDTCCQSKLDVGTLRVLDSTGAIVPSSPTARSGSNQADPYYSKNYYSEPKRTSGGVDWSRKACCFPGQVSVSTNQGSKRIDEITAGDEVLALCNETGMVEYREVTEVQVHQGEFSLLQLYLEDEIIKVTTRHFFALQGGLWQRSEMLQKGIKLKSNNSAKAIHNITSLKKWEGAVFNLKVKGGNYFIGNSTVLVRDH